MNYKRVNVVPTITDEKGNPNFEEMSSIDILKIQNILGDTWNRVEKVYKDIRNKDPRKNRPVVSFNKYHTYELVIAKSHDEYFYVKAKVPDVTHHIDVYLCDGWDGLEELLIYLDGLTT